MKCSTHSCSYRVFIVTATPPHTGIYRFVVNHRHSLLPVSAPPETHCRGQRKTIASERTGTQQSFRLQVLKDRSPFRFPYHYGYSLCSKHILSSLPPRSPIITQQQCARAELEISGKHRRCDVPGSAVQNYDFIHTL